MSEDLQAHRTYIAKIVRKDFSSTIDPEVRPNSQDLPLSSNAIESNIRANSELFLISASPARPSPNRHYHQLRFKILYKGRNLTSNNFPNEHTGRT
jgi:hypothetical protein